MGKRRGRRNAGFVLTLELILLITVLLIGTIAGWALIRDELVELLVNQRRFSVRVFDANDSYVGTAVNYDLCESPQIIYRDAGPDTTAYAILFGVRPDRFVTRDRIYYTGANCTGTPYIAAPGDQTLPVGWLNADQGQSYGVGAPRDWGGACAALPCSDGGLLYRSTDTAATPTIQSRWISLNPDCANTSVGTGTGGGSTGELIVNGSFEDPVIPVNGHFSALYAPLPTGWTVTGGGGHWNPCLVGDASCATTPNTFAVPVPDGSQVAYANGGGRLSQQVSLVAGANCTLDVSVGCRLDSCQGDNDQAYEIVLQDPSASSIVSLTGPLGAAAGSPQWQQFSQGFAVSSSGAHTLFLGNTGPLAQVNYDSVSLVCTLPGSATPAGTDICENFGPEVIALLEAEEVTITVDGTPQNIFESYTPLFWVPTLGPVSDPTPVAPRPEDEGLTGTPGTPDSLIYVNEPPTPEDDGLGTTP